jgi:O-antigen/teichoic acid export membrane protein
MVPIEGCALILVALFGGDILHASLCVCVLRWIGLLFYYQVLKRSESWVEIGFRNATKEAIRRLARPSLAALSLTLSDSLGIQAVVLTLGWSAGPAVVAIFSATRFLSRMPLQFAGLVTRAAIPELSRAVVSKDIVLLRRLLKVNVFTALAVVSPFLLALFFAGPFLLAHLSKKSLNAPEYLFIFLGIASASNAVWNAMSSPLLASNRQAEYASIYMFFCFFVMLVPFINMVPMLSTAFASMVSELLMMFVIWRKLRYHTKRNWVLD